MRRLVTGNGRTRALRYLIRLFSPPELLGWLHEAGFVNVHAFGGDGEVFCVDSGRLIVVGQRP